MDRACAAILTPKFAAGLFDGLLPDPANRDRIYTDAHRALARQVVHEGAILLANPGGFLPLNPQGKKIFVVGPNSGCPGSGPPPVNGQCNFIANTDCDGNDFQKVFNVTDPAVCCQLCYKTAGCVVAVLATDAQQCLLKVCETNDLLNHPPQFASFFAERLPQPLPAG